MPPSILTPLIDIRAFGNCKKIVKIKWRRHLYPAAPRRCHSLRSEYSGQTYGARIYRNRSPNIIRRSSSGFFSTKSLTYSAVRIVNKRQFWSAKIRISGKNKIVKSRTFSNFCACAYTYLGSSIYINVSKKIFYWFSTHFKRLDVSTFRNCKYIYITFNNWNLRRSSVVRPK